MVAAGVDRCYRVKDVQQPTVEDHAHDAIVGGKSLWLQQLSGRKTSGRAEPKQKNKQAVI